MTVSEDRHGWHDSCEEPMKAWDRLTVDVGCDLVRMGELIYNDSQPTKGFA